MIDAWWKRTRDVHAAAKECCEQYWTSPGVNTQQNSSCTATDHPSRKLSKLDEPDMQDTAWEVRTNSSATYYCVPPHMDEQRQDDQQEPIYNSSVPSKGRTTSKNLYTTALCRAKAGRPARTYIQQLCAEQRQDDQQEPIYNSSVPWRPTGGNEQ